MRKIELEIIALSHSITQSQSYAVVLGEIDGLRRLPIIIGANEAQSIAVALEKMKPSRPLTHDLMKNFFNAYNITLHEVVINDLQEGIFFAKLICSNDKETVEIDSRTSDAIALALRLGCPMYTFENILDSAGLLMEAKPKTGTTEKIKSVNTNTDSNLQSLKKEDLETLLQTVLEQEDYIKAAAIRDELNSRK